MDNFFSVFSRRTARREATTTDSGTTAADWTERITPTTGRQSLLVPAWYRGLSLIMQTMGQMLVQYQRRDREGGNYIEDTRGEGRRLNYLLQVRPNPMLTASQLLEQIEYKKAYEGNAYVYLDRDALGEVNALWLCSSGSYDITTDSYNVTYWRPGGLRGLAAPSRDVLHFKNVFLSDDFISGLPTVRYAARALSIAATADTQSLRDMAKGGKYKILVQENTPQSGTLGLLSAGRANQSELKKATEALGEDWMDKDAVFFTNIADAKVISQTAAELKLLETRGFSVADLARLLGVPRAMLMDDSNSSYKTPEAATQEFLLRTIQPRVREMEDELNSKLLSLPDFGRRRLHICEQALRRLDPTEQARLDKLHLESGTHTVNELRKQYDMPGVEGGDAVYLSTNLALLGSEKLSQNGTPGAPAGVAEEEEGGAV